MEVFYNQVVKTVTVNQKKHCFFYSNLILKKGSIYNERIRKNNRIN